MNRDAVRGKIAELLGEILDEEDLHLSNDTTADDVDGWDSVNHVKLIVAIEREFNIRFGADEISAPKNVGELVDLVTRHKAAA